MASNGSEIPQQQIDEIIKKLCVDILQIYKDTKFDTKDLHDCLVKLMECVETIPQLIGVDKKKIVIGVIIVVIDSLQIVEIEKSKILFMITSGILSEMIDMIVKLSKNIWKINTHIHMPCLHCKHSTTPKIHDTNELVDIPIEKSSELQATENVGTTRHNICDLL